MIIAIAHRFSDFIIHPRSCRALYSAVFKRCMRIRNFGKLFVPSQDCVVDIALIVDNVPRNIFKSRMKAFYTIPLCRGVLCCVAMDKGKREEIIISLIICYIFFLKQTFHVLLFLNTMSSTSLKTVIIITSSLHLSFWRYFWLSFALLAFILVYLALDLWQHGNCTF